MVVEAAVERHDADDAGLRHRSEVDRVPGREVAPTQHQLLGSLVGGQRDGKYVVDDPSTTSNAGWIASRRPMAPYRWQISCSTSASVKRRSEREMARSSTLTRLSLIHI